ncbi:MAG: MnhB domain-containing protein [Haloferacaceae archaeon]
MSGRDGSGTEPEPGTITRPAESRQPYVESTIIMTTVRVIAPFVLTLGLFVMFHGTSSAGGGFQGGVIAATTVVMLGFAFGIESVADRLRGDHLTVLVLAGIGTFLAVGLGPYALGGTLLEFGLYPVHHASKYSIELIELGIGVVVAGTITGLFFLLGSGLDALLDGEAEADADADAGTEGAT